ncbi:hypothetical protein CSQ85_12185 [Bifidobacterium rousetti]|uniref:InlB B-repeat-containing protein n=1 Tax=Bifidobacterium rousetti TaxID=2045439 RepID=UPI00123C70CB|nr:InlB B-repeat-containing protein [Bifidobacterium rousetti]KAA8816079.1 hypothetical protein CSQ85_12185 [Bifidobacterium rousetti]
MTGNTKVWRAPLAGLASVAMLATMGVAAGTASAASTADVKDPTVSFYYEGAKSAYWDRQVVYGDSTVDALSGNVQTPENKGAVVGGKYFVGYYTTDGKPFDFTAPVTADTKVVAKYAEEQDVVKVAFEGDFGFYPLGSADAYLLKGSTLAAAQAPTDKADGQLTTSWSVTGAGVDTTTIKDNTVDSLDKVAVTRPQDSTIPTVTVKAKTFATGVKTLRFNGDSAGYAPGSYALNAYADGANGDDLLVDTTASAYATPQIITPSSVEKAGYSAWKNAPGTQHSTKVGADVSTDGNPTFEVDPDSKLAYVVVTFDSKGGSDVAAQRVFLDQNNGVYGFVEEPAAPTKAGYVFKGWKTPSGSYVDFGTISARVTADVTLTADWQATTSELKVTFRDAEYNGRNADVAVKVNGSDFVSKDQAPAWTRSGYILAGWTKEDGSDFDFDADVAANVNGGNDFVLTAKWVKATADLAKVALNYVTDADEAKFTAASWSEFSASYDKVEKEYKQAEFTADASGISAETSAKLVSELKAAWEKLVFAHETGADVTGETTVHRLSNRNGDHFYTQDPVELAVLTSTATTKGGWTDEGRLFESPDPKLNGEFVDFTQAAKDAGLTGDAAKDAATRLADAAEPIVRQVYRLYNKTNGDHVWTIDENEYKTLAASAAWNDEGAAFFTPTFTGTTTVTRLYKDARHLLSTDANEQKVLSGKPGWKVEGTVFKAY